MKYLFFGLFLSTSSVQAGGYVVNCYTGNAGDIVYHSEKLGESVAFMIGDTLYSADGGSKEDCVVEMESM